MGVQLDLGLESVLYDQWTPSAEHEGWEESRRPDGTWVRGTTAWRDRTAIRMHCECGWADEETVELAEFDGDQEAMEDESYNRWSRLHARPWVLNEGLPQAWRRIKAKAASIRAAADRLAENTDPEHRQRTVEDVRRLAERLAEMASIMSSIEEDVDERYRTEAQ